jgi:hypothetical protein
VKKIQRKGELLAAIEMREGKQGDQDSDFCPLVPPARK